MKIILLIGLGSFLGGISRYLVTIYIHNRYLSNFPFGTLAVNAIGCFLIGLVYVYAFSNLGLSIFLGLAATLAGIFLIKSI